MGQPSYVNDTYEDREEDLVDPAADIPELAQPRVGFIRRFETNQNRARAPVEEEEEEEEEEDELRNEPDEVDERNGAQRGREKKVGFIRKVKGVSAPPLEEDGG